MKNLKDLMNETLDKFNKEGVFEEMFEEKLKKAFSDSIDSLFGYSGPLKKSIETHLKENIKLNTESLDMASYNELISKKIQIELSKKLTEESNKAVMDSINEIFLSDKRAVKPEYQIDEFLSILCSYDEIKDYSHDNLSLDDGYANLECSLHIDGCNDEKSGLVFIYFDVANEQEKYRCKHRIVVGKNGIINCVRASVNGDMLSTVDSFLLNCKFQGVKIKGLSNKSNSMYDLDVSENYEEYERYGCSC